MGSLRRAGGITISSVILACVCGTATATPFQNGSFELPTTSTGTPSFKTNGDTSITGWVVTTTGGADDFYQVRTPDQYTLAATNGSQVVCINNATGTASIAQTFDTTPAQLYTVTFDLSHEVADNADAITISVGATGNTAQNYTSGGAGTDAWVNETYAFIATGSSTTLTFSQTGGSGNNSPVLDNVVVATPEPASMTLLAAGGAMLLLRRRIAPQR